MGGWNWSPANGIMLTMGTIPVRKIPCSCVTSAWMARGTFTAHTIDYGPAGQASGVGIYFWVEDLTGDGRPDIVAPGKEGLYLFRSQK
jgi:hypothetical protein